MALGAGSILGDKLVLERELGSGGGGVVWVANHRELESRVAVKLLLGDLAESHEARERFVIEARAVARIDSPHVVTLFDYGVTDAGEPFVVMELLSGHDLRSHLEEHGPLSLEDAIAVMRQVCVALTRAHELGVVHRDIKPANVFLIDGTDGIFVKVLDFGIAKRMDRDLELTKTSALLGTPYYMSPEQFIDASAVDHRTDLWSLAVVIYACLTGRLPFLGDSVGALSVAVHRGDVPPPCSLRATLPTALDAWFRRALDPNPALRFSSARELAQTFADAARGKDTSLAMGTTTSAGAMSSTIEMRPPRRWPLVALAALVLAAAAAFLWLREPAGASNTAGEQVHEVEVRILPADAWVTVNGVKQPLEGGVLRLRGKSGEHFVVKVKANDLKLKETIFITRDGLPSHDQLDAADGHPKPAGSGEGGG